MTVAVLGGLESGEDVKVLRTGASAGDTGVTTVTLSDGKTQVQCSALNYVNESLLEKDESSPDLMRVKSAGTTSLITGGLEASKTDLATEISEMITTQRGYQANTRIVTVTDSMLEELVNMKR
jgi:flagellar hook protein FlgE